MKETFLSWFLNVLTINLSMLIVGLFLMGLNPNVYEVAERIARNVEVDPQMLSTLKNWKYIWSMKPGAKFETSMLGPMGFLVALFKIQIGQGYSKSCRFVGRHFITTFLTIIFIGVFRKIKCDKNRHLLGFIPHTYFCIFDSFTNIFTSFRNTVIY